MSEDALVSTRTLNGETHVLPRYNRAEHELRANGIRRTPALFGIGLLEQSAGRSANGTKVPIFGALLERNSLDDVVANALANELGVSSSKYCARLPSDSQVHDCRHLITDSELADLVQFVRYLAPPPRKSKTSVAAGESLFQSMRCVQCHIPLLPKETAAFFPKWPEAMAYTDLLRHDLGSGIAVRTTALWGVTSLGPPYLHDASANSLHEAILNHKGEAVESTKLYQKLTDAERELLFNFLKSI